MWFVLKWEKGEKAQAPQFLLQWLMDKQWTAFSTLLFSFFLVFL